jgi:hypothetical protein
MLLSIQYLIKIFPFQLNLLIFIIIATPKKNLAQTQF